MTQNNLGDAYSDLPSGDRSENLRRAIACYEAALRVYTEADYPADWAEIQNDCGLVFEALGDLPKASAAFSSYPRFFGGWR